MISNLEAKPTTISTRSSENSNSPQNSHPVITWFFRGTKTILGISAAGALIFLSRPLMSYITREICMSMQNKPRFWPNPISGILQWSWSKYQCEWMGHWGFNFYEVFSWLSSSWQTILTSIGSVSGAYALIRTLKNRRKSYKNPQQAELTTEQKQRLNDFLSAFSEHRTLTDSGLNESDQPAVPLLINVDNADNSSQDDSNILSRANSTTEIPKSSNNKKKK